MGAVLVKIIFWLRACIASRLDSVTQLSMQSFRFYVRARELSVARYDAIYHFRALQICVGGYKVVFGVYGPKTGVVRSVETVS